MNNLKLLFKSDNLVFYIEDGHLFYRKIEIKDTLSNIQHLDTIHPIKKYKRTWLLTDDVIYYDVYLELGNYMIVKVNGEYTLEFISGNLEDYNTMINFNLINRL